MRLPLRLSLLGLFVTLAAQAQQTIRPLPISCFEPRPEICPMIYGPVCGVKKDGSKQTYSNGCTACGDAAVESHTAGACN